MARTRINCYLDVVVSHPDMTPEEREEELQRLKEESDKLTAGHLFIKGKRNIWQEMIIM